MPTRTLLGSKIHGATVTLANQDYEGSIGIDAELMDEADILEYEQVHVWNVTNGNRIITYAIPIARNAVKVDDSIPPFEINGAAAHLFSPGDKIIVATFMEMSIMSYVELPNGYHPIVLIMDDKNQIKEIKGDV
jgi:aspartate 1-decarboxylase